MSFLRSAVCFFGVCFFSATGKAVDQKEIEQPKTVEATVFYCSDGDTCRVKVSEALWLNVRLAGIDAPEIKGHKKKGQPFGEESRDFLNKRVKNKTVTLRQTDLDQYNRPVVEIFMGEELINKSIVESGFAEAYRGKTKRLDKSVYLNAEESAKKLRKGIWSQSHYESPAEFRKSAKLSR